jgi:hypothetical protein
MVVRLRTCAGDIWNFENWLTKSLSAESLCFTSTGAVKDLRGGFPPVPQKGSRAYDIYQHN